MFISGSGLIASTNTTHKNKEVKNINLLVEHGNWNNAEGTWYYNINGHYTIGWEQINGTWYHFAENGAMQTGWQKINGTWYYFATSGAMNTGWQQLNETWYYFSGSGAMQTGWTHLNGATYYLNENGAMFIGNHNINGTEYTFNSSGQMISQKVDMIAPNAGANYGSVSSPSGLWLVSNPSMNPNKKYYVMTQNSAFKILGQTKDHKWYYVDYKGTKGWCYAEFVKTYTNETNNTGKAAYVNSQIGLWLKEKPSLTSARLSLVPYQTQVRIIATNGNWSEANVNGQVGWLYTEYLTFTNNNTKN